MCLQSIASALGLAAADINATCTQVIGAGGGGCSVAASMVAWVTLSGPTQAQLNASVAQLYALLSQQTPGGAQVCEGAPGPHTQAFGLHRVMVLMTL